MLLICPKLPRQKFIDPPFEEEILTFIGELGYPGNIKLLSDVKVDTLPQPWRTFGTIINKCLSGATKNQNMYVDLPGQKFDEDPILPPVKEGKARIKVAKSEKNKERSSWNWKLSQT
ncbi:hypothetical protein Tco_0134912 [Tanacetum coccineum]